jgi:hypothetical protein
MVTWQLFRLLGLSVISLALAACSATTINQAGSGDNVCANASCAQGATNSQRSPAAVSDQKSEASSATPTVASPEQSASEGPSKLYEEETYNHLGTKVFRDPAGDAITSGPVSIPFGTQVLVKCWAPNESDMGSINAFYLVETRPWAGEYAPANTFLNADTTGDLDPHVPKCRAI